MPLKEKIKRALKEKKNKEHTLEYAEAALRLLAKASATPILNIRSAWYSFLLTGKPYPFAVKITSLRAKIKITKSLTAKATIKDPLIIHNWLGNDAPAVIELSALS